MNWKATFQLLKGSPCGNRNLSVSSKTGMARTRVQICATLESARIRPPLSARIALVRIFILAFFALVLCSCADSYEILGLHLKRAADDDRDNAGHGYMPGAGDPGN